jgi:hypothetical protein
MTVHVDIWLRGTDFATSDNISGIGREPDQWTEGDVQQVLEGMLRAMDRAKNPGQPDRAVALRGLSWIVNAFEAGGVVIAIEITLGAAIAGPFAIDKSTLEALITRVLARATPPAPTVH